MTEAGWVTNGGLLWLTENTLGEGVCCGRYWLGTLSSSSFRRKNHWARHRYSGDM